MASWPNAMLWITTSIAGLKISLATDCLYYYKRFYYDATYNEFKEKNTSGYLYCYYSCCGTTKDQYCCYDYYQFEDVSTGGVIAIVVGSMVAVGLLITAVICLRTRCCWIQAIRDPALRTNGTYINTSTNQRVHTISSAGMLPMQSYPRVQNQGHFPVVAMDYNSTSAPPPSYDACMNKVSTTVGRGIHSSARGRGGGFDVGGGGGGGSGGGYRGADGNSCGGDGGNKI